MGKSGFSGVLAIEYSLWQTSSQRPSTNTEEHLLKRTIKNQPTNQNSIIHDLKVISVKPQLGSIFEGFS